MRPYQQIPFQWSIHRQLSRNNTLEHFEFLAEDRQDPRRRFTESLLAKLGSTGHVICYNKTFESQRLAELAGWFPDLERAVTTVRNRLWDLLPVVRKHVYHSRFQGSFSLKSVLPALVPELTYDGMDVANAIDAGIAWDRLVWGDPDETESCQLRSSLLAYCRQDTLAMVRILEQLRMLSRGNVSVSHQLLNRAYTMRHAAAQRSRHPEGT